MTPALSLVVAAHGQLADVAAWLDAVRPQIAAQPAASIEVLVCHRPDAATAPDPSGGISPWSEAEWLRLVPCAQHALVPEMWRDGIAASRAPRVALSVVDCLPDAGWLAALLAADLESYCAVGGAIDCDPSGDGVSLAVYLLRYARYGRPFDPLETDDLPGDNALYDRIVLLRHQGAYADGFWEPEIHALLAREGRRMLRDPAIVALHHNSYGVLEFAAQRLAHGRRFGRDRAAAMPPLRRMLYLAASPAVPFILAAKVMRIGLAGRATRQALPRAAPALGLFLLSWGAGEMRGILDAVLAGGAGA